MLPQPIEALGHTATRDDQAALQALEALRGRSGEPSHVSYEALDEMKLAWRERLAAARKGIAPERLRARITYRGTGLLDQKLPLVALQSIRGRTPER